MSSATIKVNELEIRYGKTTALQGVSLEVPAGSVYALLGRNGAGKSSLIRCLLGLQCPQGGSIEVSGLDAWRSRAKIALRTGVVTEEPDAPPEMTARQLARFCSRLYPQWDAASVSNRLERFGVPQDVPYGKLSKGQKKEVSLALALASGPEILILDDPTLGLDVVARNELIEEVIGEMADRSLTVFITTHDLAAVEGVVDRVGILQQGSLVLDESVETLKDRFRRIRFGAAAPAPDSEILQALAAVGVKRWGRGLEAIVSRFDETSTQPGLADAEVSPMSLEEIFVALNGEGVSA